MEECLHLGERVSSLFSALRFGESGMKEIGVEKAEEIVSDGVQNCRQCRDPSCCVRVNIGLVSIDRLSVSDGSYSRIRPSLSEVSIFSIKD